MAEFTLYSQMDPAWKLKRLGDSREATIGSFGCLLTCMAMVASAYGQEVTPPDLNDRMKAAGGFQGAYIIPAYIPSAVPGVSFNNYEQCSDHPAPMGQIDAFLQQGKPVIVEVDYSPKDGMQNHWIVLYARRDGDYLLRDPYPYPAETKDILLTKSRYNFAGDPQSIITGVVWLDGTLQSAPPPPPPVTPPSVPDHPTLTVYAAADALAMRSSPMSAADNLIRRLPLNTELGALEAADTARQKLQTVNQWLYVQDSSGQRGYVAAWYLSLEKQTPPPPPPPAPPAPPPTPGQLVVKTVVESLSLRSEPRVADETRLKFLPLFASLKVLEPAAQAQAKVGVRDQWLHVEDITGTQGYVAAVYVTDSDDTALGARPAPKQQPTADPNKLVVRPGVEGLALRTQPVVGQATLIKHLPIATDLVVLEPAAEGRRKIGAMGKWLKVADVTGAQGYVAAWYVSEVK